jgi:hypothetical protein
VSKKKPAKSGDAQLVGFLGVGLDNADGHRRLTRSEHFILVGGSEATHDRMQETAVRFDESLKKRGKTLQEASPDEALDLLRKAMEE